jgi:hypothetical protein
LTGVDVREATEGAVGVELGVLVEMPFLEGKSEALVSMDFFVVGVIGVCLGY